VTACPISHLHLFPHNRHHWRPEHQPTEGDQGPRTVTERLAGRLVVDRACTGTRRRKTSWRVDGTFTRGES
jgi:hypothetical protein